MQKAAIATLVTLCLVFSFGACRRRRARVAITSQPPAWLEGVVLDQAKQNAPDAKQVGNIYKGVAHEEDGRTQWQMLLEGGTCYWFSTAGDQSVEQLYVNLWDPSEDRVAKLKLDGPKLVLAYCTKVAGMYKLEVKVTKGAGHYHVGVFGKAAPGGPAPTSAPPPPATPERLAQVIAEMAKSSASGARLVGELFEGENPESDWYVQFEPGKCYWLIGAGEKEVEELYLYLWDPKDSRVTANKSDTNRVTIGHCPTVGGMFHFQVKIGRGNGKYKVGVYAKKK